VLDSRHSISLDFLRYLLQGDVSGFRFSIKIPAGWKPGATEAKPTEVGYGKIGT